MGNGAAVFPVHSRHRKAAIKQVKKYFSCVAVLSETSEKQFKGYLPLLCTLLLHYWCNTKKNDKEKVFHNLQLVKTIDSAGGPKALF